jgi:hypothetical protein
VFIQSVSLKAQQKKRPALWKISNGHAETFSYIFPRNPRDFLRIKDLISGTPPLSHAEDFKKLPRYGLTGLHKFNDCFYAGGWNSVYEIDAKTCELKRLISHQLMSDLHGIWVDKEGIISILTSKDTIVFTDFDGSITDCFSITKDLNIVNEARLAEIDWRFISKQYRGSCGFWHFNYAQRYGDELWLTSRCASSFIVVDMKKKKASLRLMNHCTPILLHDGVNYNGKYYFTSIDGKIIIAEDPSGTNKTDREYVDNLHLYNRDLITSVIRLQETELGREPNWCRGIACYGEYIYVTIDGRYDTDLSFGVIGIDHKGILLDHFRLKWSDIGSEEQLRYVTGFDVCIDP